MSTKQGHELRLDVPEQQKPMLLLDYTAEACAVLRPVCTLGPKLHLDVSTLQSPVLNLDMSTPHKS
jgi:hypothetical protein